MSTCPACATPTTASFRYCPTCGTDLDLPDSPTGTAPRRARDAASPSSPSPASPSPAFSTSAGADRGSKRDEERFLPGQVLAGRYRIVGLLGRGGMGEVYRADDLKLEQPVALKFLSRARENDAERIERLYSEVRIARQVSHASVCRVWDVGEAEGQHFLSMEFVDGENLASLLRRIGRFPQDKAIDVARQIAEGLAAAHAKGLLHRDLKPANVMLDSRGHVRITDFGLAGFAESLTGDVRSGTPAYMSPEQLQGREVTLRSDVYALGLLIYELVTGRRAFTGKGFAELARKHRDERPVDPSVLVPNLDPAIERTLLACLEKEPRKRPPSALAVAAMLEGRDPLQAALAAGETPSPELVAAAGEAAGLRPVLARACLAVTVIGVLALPVIEALRHPFTLVPVEKSPAAIEDRARELLGRLGAAKAADSDIGFRYDNEYLRWAEPRDRSRTRWNTLATGDPPLIEVWYRQSPRPLGPLSLNSRVSLNDPPVLVAGMAGARYDLRGRLVACYVVPPQLEKDEAATVGPEPAAGEPDWSLLFAEARLDPADLRRVEPIWSPPFFADTRAAWEGHWPARPDLPLRVEAAARGGRPVWFETLSPWTRPERDQTASLTARQRGIQVVYILVLVALCLVGGGLAWRNLSQGQGDRRGAFRLALALALAGIASWSFRAHHVEDPTGEMASFARGAGVSLVVASLLWLFYLALEPYVRRLRPWTLVAWTRLLNGGWRHPVVGREVLVGMAFGVCLVLLRFFTGSLLTWLGYPERAPEALGLDTLLYTRRLLGYMIGLPVNATLAGLALLLLFLVLRLLTRHDWIAAFLVVAFLVTGDLTEAGEAREYLWVTLPLAALAWSAYLVLLLRYGVLAAVTTVFTADLLVGTSLLYAPGSWTGGNVAVVVPLVLALAVLAYRSAIRGRRGLERYLAREAADPQPV
jgi:serine/threonine-protein kinase